jgi:hypothetical protein
MNDPATDLIGVAEQTGGTRQIARHKRFAYQRAADSFAVYQDRWGIDHLESCPFAGLLEKVKVALPSPAETEIVADHQVTDTQRIDEDALNKIVGLHAGQSSVEAQDQCEVDRQFGKPVDFFAEAHQSWRGTFRIKEFARLGLEQDHANGKATFLALRSEPFDDCTVAKVHTIEIANRGDTAIRWQV